MTVPWTIKNSVETVTIDDETCRITEKVEEGEHFVSTWIIDVLDKNSVEVSVVVSDVTSNTFMFYLTSDDGSAYQIFDLTKKGSKGKLISVGAFGPMETADAAIELVGEEKFKATVVFELMGEAKQAWFRVQMLQAPDKSSIYVGDATKGMSISDAEIQ